MTPEIAKIVGMKTQPKALNDFCQKLKDLVKVSRTEMSKYYDQWDYFDQVYRGERKVDKQDLKARQRGEPEKLILPLTYAQVQTFVAFGYSTFNQRDTFYETIASGEEDEQASKIATAALEQNLNHNKFKATKLVQDLTDIARFGIGITKESWVTETTPCVSQVPDPEAMGPVDPELAQPVAPKMKTEVVYNTKYQGNKIVNISPYRFFPDVRLPLTRWSEGEFCADEIEESKTALMKLQEQGLVAGLENVSPLPDDAYSNRRMTFLKGPNTGSNTMGVVATDPQFYLRTEVQIILNPSTTLIDEGTPLNPDVNCDQVYVVWIGNDDRIIRISEAGYNHEEFGYNVAQFFDDQNRFINLSLCEILSALQDTATWFLNSHITSVRKTIFNQLVADPSGIEIDDIVKRSPVIRLKQGRAGSGVDNWIKQLQVSDVTQNHMSDVQGLSSLAKEASGINENMLGQFSPGRRSAKEAGAVANAAAARLIMIMASIWESQLGPMGRKMLSNLRQGLDEPTYVRIFGQANSAEVPNAWPQFKGMPPMTPGAPGQPPPQQPPSYQLAQITKANLVGNYDLNIFNGTLPSQRAQTANVLMEWLQTAMKDPRIVLLSNLDPQLVLYEVFELLGVRNVQRFRLTPQRLQQLMLMANPAPNPGNPNHPQVGGGQPQQSPA